MVQFVGVAEKPLTGLVLHGGKARLYRWMPRWVPRANEPISLAVTIGVHLLDHRMLPADERSKFAHERCGTRAVVSDRANSLILHRS